MTRANLIYHPNRDTLRAEGDVVNNKAGTRGINWDRLRPHGCICDQLDPGEVMGSSQRPALPARSSGSPTNHSASLRLSGPLSGLLRRRRFLTLHCPQGTIIPTPIPLGVELVLHDDMIWGQSVDGTHQAGNTG